MDTVILIPAYKPGSEFPGFIDKLAEGNTEIVVVDDGSGSDYNFIFGTVSDKCHVIQYMPNMGKGRALKTGFEYIRKNLPGCRYIVTADADGQHRISDINNVAEKLKSCEPDNTEAIVIGARHFENDVPFKSKLGNLITRAVFGVLTGYRITDTQTGLRGFYSSQLEWLEQISGERYEYEMNVLMEAAEQKIMLKEIKIETVYEKGNSSSHFRAVRDSIRIYGTIFAASTSLKFLMSSCIAFAVDYLLFLTFGGILKQTPFDKSVRIAVATFAAWVVSSLTNYTINRRIVFKKKDEAVRSFVGYYSLAGIVYLVKLGIIELLSVIIGVPEWLSKLVAEVTLFISNYFIQKKIIFRKNKDKKVGRE